MTAAWPSNVNQYAQTGSYGEKPDTNVVPFTPEVGPPKLRRRMSIASDTISFSVWMTGAEYALFLTFYRTTLKDGTLPFTRLRPRTNSTETFIFTGEAPSMKDIGFDHYEVSMTMKNMP